MLKRLLRMVPLCVAAGTLTLWGQGEPGGMMMGPGPGHQGGPHQGLGPSPNRMHRGGPGPRWWLDPRMAEKVGVTEDQKKRMDEVFQQSRLRLIDLTASLQKEEAILEPLLAADQPDDAKVLPQLDRVVQARGELEKARAKMLLGFRKVLTPEQWKKLNQPGPVGPPPNRPPMERRQPPPDKL